MLEPRPDLQFDAASIATHVAAVPLEPKHKVIAAVPTHLWVSNVVRRFVEMVVRRRLVEFEELLCICDGPKHSPATAKVLDLVELCIQPPKLLANRRHAFQPSSCDPFELELSDLADDVVAYPDHRMEMRVDPVVRHGEDAYHLVSRHLIPKDIPAQCFARRASLRSC
jgi:hypothetical protein